MFKQLSYDRFTELAESNQRVAVYREIPGDKLTAISLYLALSQSFKDITLLETSPKDHHLGRYSYLCFNQVAMIKSFGQKLMIQEKDSTKTKAGDPFETLRTYQKKFRATLDHPQSGFVGGMVGFVSYDAIRLIEKIPNSNFVKDDIPDTYFRFYDHNITFDHQTRMIVISVVAHIQKDLKAAYQDSIQKINEIQQAINIQHHSQDINVPKNSEALRKIEITTDLDDESYKQNVETAKKYIKAGDIFQVVLSREFRMKTCVNPFDVYRALRFRGPAPYMFYFAAEDFVLAGASPEKLVSVNEGIVESRPLAGTRPRKKTISDDLVAAELLSDEKEIAEHMMLVDLARNDIGSISIPGSVEVVKLLAVEKFASVMHLSSTVQGKLREDLDAMDALKASFPAGTLSGAPKIRAMEIIDELESTRRGFYGGAICAFDSRGNLESCIAIRTAVIRNSVAVVRAGGGIVLDSDPQKEADETFHKARSILEGIQFAQEIPS